MQNLLIRINALSGISKFFLTIMLLLLVTLPRFNRNELIVKREMNDARYFKAYVEYFRGEEPSAPIRPASNWRFLIPFVAALLPLAPLTAINIVNLCCIALSLWIMMLMMKKLDIKEAYRWLGVWLFIVSFPTFYYTTIGYIEPGVLLFVSLVAYFSVTQQFIFVLCSFIAGAMAKETIIIALPFVFVYSCYFNKRLSWLWTVVILLVYIIENMLIREYVYITPGDEKRAFWGFSMEAVMNNLKRFNSYAAPLLSIGIPGLLFFFCSKNADVKKIISTPILLATWAAIIATVVIFITTYIATFADGRVIWHAYYFMIPASMWWLSSHEQKTTE